MAITLPITDSIIYTSDKKLIRNMNTFSDLSDDAGSSTDIGSSNLTKEKQPCDPPNTIIRYINTGALTGPAQWSLTEEDTVQKYIDKARGYQYLYNKTFYYYRFYHFLITIPLAIASTLSVALQTVFSTIIVTNQADQPTQYHLISTILSAIVSLLTYVHMQFNFDHSASYCKDLAIQYSNFADELEAMLSFPREYRANPVQVITSIQADYKKILKVSEPINIPRYILEKYVCLYHDKATLADIVGDFGIHTENGQMYSTVLQKNKVLANFVNKIRDKKMSNNIKS